MASGIIILDIRNNYFGYPQKSDHLLYFGYPKYLKVISDIRNLRLIFDIRKLFLGYLEKYAVLWKSKILFSDIRNCFQDIQNNYFGYLEN